MGTQLTDRYANAVAVMCSWHAGQIRKGTDIPYTQHLLATSALVLEFGGDEDQAIAGLLHDSVEDQAHKLGGADNMLAAIAVAFGHPVATIVMHCTDATVIPKPDWATRKTDYLAHWPSLPRASKLVSGCDKLHNALSTASDYEREGDAVWSRFKMPADAQRWYYGSLAQLVTADGLPMAKALRDAVARFS